MDTSAYLKEPLNGITRPVLRKLLSIFGIEYSKQAFKEELQNALKDLPLIDVREEFQHLLKSYNIQRTTTVAVDHLVVPAIVQEQSLT
jgi:hypothetical protein